jgi:hypothetical protein
MVEGEEKIHNGIVTKVTDKGVDVLLRGTKVFDLPYGDAVPHLGDACRLKFTSWDAFVKVQFQGKLPCQILQKP